MRDSIPQYAIHTTSGETFSGDETSLLAALVYKRFGWDKKAAAAAWRRLLGNSCTENQFETLAGYATPAVRSGLRYVAKDGFVTGSPFNK